MRAPNDTPLGIRGWIVALIFISGAYVQFEPAPFDGLMILAIVGWAMSFSFRWARSFAWMGLLLVPYILSQLAGIIISADASASLPVGAVTIYLACLVPALASLAHNQRWNVSEGLLTGCLIAGVLSSILCTLAYVGLMPGEDILLLFSRATGGFKDPNVFAAWLVPPFLFAFSRGLESKGRPGLLYTFSAAICGLGLLLAFSRGAWGQTAVALMVVYGLMKLTPGPDGNPRRARPVLWIVGGFCVLLTVIYFSQNQDFTDLWEMRFGKQDYDQERFSAHRDGWVIGAKSFFGVGPGRVDDVVGMNVHNNYLHTLLETGWIGLLSFVAFLAASIFRATRYALVAPNGQDRLYFRVAAASLIGLAAESWIIDVYHWRHFWYMAAMAWFPVRQGLVFLPSRASTAEQEIEEEQGLAARDPLDIPDASW